MVSPNLYLALSTAAARRRIEEIIRQQGLNSESDSDHFDELVRRSTQIIKQTGKKSTMNFASVDGCPRNDIKAQNSVNSDEICNIFPTGCSPPDYDEDFDIQWPSNFSQLPQYSSGRSSLTPPRSGDMYTFLNFQLKDAEPSWRANVESPGHLYRTSPAVPATITSTLHHTVQIMVG